MSESQSEKSIGELLQQLSEQSSRLIREEMQLAQAELKATIERTGKSAGLFGAAGMLAWFGFGAALATATIALALVLPLWAAALIVTVVLFVLAGIAALFGKKEATDIPKGPKRSAKNVKADIQEVKEARS